MIFLYGFFISLPPIQQHSCIIAHNCDVTLLDGFSRMIAIVTEFPETFKSGVEPVFLAFAGFALSLVGCWPLSYIIGFIFRL